MLNNLIRARTDLSTGVHLTRMGRLFAEADQGAHTIEVSVTRDGSSVPLTGATIRGYFIRGDEATLSFTGTASGNTASLTLPASCYIRTGHFSLVIKAVSGDDIITLFWGDGTVSRTTTDIIVDPDNVIPSLDDLLAQIATIEAATEAASDAAEAANAVAELLPDVQGAIGDATDAAAAANTVAAKLPDVTDAISAANTAAAAASDITSQITDAIVPHFSIAEVQTLAPNQSATVTLTWGDNTSRYPELNFGIPKGENGDAAVMTGATESTDGVQGAAPKPLATEQNRVLTGAGTWESLFIDGTPYGMDDYKIELGILYGALVSTARIYNATPVTAGVMSANDKAKLDGLSNYTLPTATGSTLGGVKVGTGVDMTDGVLSVPVMVGPGTGTSGTAGLVPAPGVTAYNKFLRGDGTWATPSGGGGGTSVYKVLLDLDSLVTTVSGDTVTIDTSGWVSASVSADTALIPMWAVRMPTEEPLSGDPYPDIRYPMYETDIIGWETDTDSITITFKDSAAATAASTDTTVGGIGYSALYLFCLLTETVTAM